MLAPISIFAYRITINQSRVTNHHQTMKKHLLLFITTICLSHFLIAQTDSIPPDNQLLRKSSIIVLPLAFYTPETRFGGGAASIFAFRIRGNSDETKPSQAQIGFAYTQEKQILSYLPFQLYFKEQKWFSYGELGYYRYVYQFYGVGNDTNEDDKEAYDANYPRVRLNVLKKVSPKIYVGARYWFDDYQIENREANGLLDKGDFTGQKGGIISGLGLVANRDSRDQVFYPTKGNFTDVVLYTNQKNLGSDFNFTRFSVDAAQYIKLSENGILATNAFIDFVFGEPPFQQLAFIGGSKKLRGFFEGRYRDKKMWILQAEYRQWIWKFIGGTIFAGAGSVAPEIGDFTSQKIHYSYGAGLRIRVSKKDKINLRLDAGFDEEFNFLPYITVNEAF